ncbi:MAG: hypothetical protein U0163_03880 [Gemmatimonadaceae bacterium]
MAPPEQALWLTLYPLAVGGQRDPGSGRYRWQVPSAPGGRRWRSVRTALGTGGAGGLVARGARRVLDAGRSSTRRRRNPTLVLDFGDVSENSVLLQPDSLVVSGADSTYHGRRVVGLDTLNTERDLLAPLVPT